MSDLTIPPLDEQCATCEGTREVTNPAFAEWEQRYDVAEKAWKATNPDRGTWWQWQQSYECKGIEEDAPSEVMPCPDCGGTGAILTDAGRTLLAFLDRHRNLGAVRSDLAALQRRIRRVSH